VWQRRRSPGSPGRPGRDASTQPDASASAIPGRSNGRSLANPDCRDIQRHSQGANIERMNRVVRRLSVVVACLASATVLAVPAIAQQATPPPPAAVAVATIKVPGTSGRWDVMQVDPAAHRLYLSNTSNGSLDVFDTQTFATLAQIPGLPNSQDAQGAWSGANGLALAPELNRAFVSDQVDNSLHVYDTNSNAQTDVVSPTQKGSDSVAYDPDAKKVFVSNGDSNSITVVDASTLKVLKQINLPGAPEIAVWDTADHTLRQN